MGKKKKKIGLPKMRIPLPKQRNQAFKDHTKYDRKRDKGSAKDPFNFLVPN
jgi:hypothetical protein